MTIIKYGCCFDVFWNKLVTFRIAKSRDVLIMPRARITYKIANQSTALYKCGQIVQGFREYPATILIKGPDR